MQGNSEADERLRRVMGEATQSTERRVFVGGMPFGYEVTSLPTQHKPWHRDRVEVLWHAIVWQLRAAPIGCIILQQAAYTRDACLILVSKRHRR